MAVLMEPPRARPVLRETARYPGLTPEERGFDALPISVPPMDPEPPPPLWVVPSEGPRASPGVGFITALPETAPPSPPPPEGLFDVPGLLERLWLARALEAGRARPPAGSSPGPDPPRPSPVVGRPSAAQSGAIATAASPPAPQVPVRPPPAAELPRAGTPPEVRNPPPPAPPRTVPYERSWVCPYCYLANNANANTCRGCGKGGD